MEHAHRTPGCSRSGSRSGKLRPQTGQIEGNVANPLPCRQNRCPDICDNSERRAPMNEPLVVVDPESQAAIADEERRQAAKIELIAS